MAKKINLRDQVRDYLLKEMTKGTLDLGKTINLAAVSRALNLSVTPIREALAQLQQAHIIKAVPNRGFIIAELDVKEAEDLYDLVASLEVMAIENREFSETDIINLRKQQDVFENAANAIARIQADMEFHRLLTQGFENELALQLLYDLKTKDGVIPSGEEEYNYFLAVLFPAEQLKILPYNRVVLDLRMSEEEFINKVKTNFTIESANSPSPNKEKEICMYLSGKWHLLKPNENVKKADDVGGNLDVSILQNYILQPFLGVVDIRTDTNIDFIGGIRGTQELEKLVDSGKAQVAFSMYPVSVDDLINISDAGETMPPKSTWFEPKLRDGLVVHTI